MGATLVTYGIVRFIKKTFPTKITPAILAEFNRIKKHLDSRCINPTITVSMMALELAISPRALKKAVVAFSGEQIRDYVQSMRVELIKERLRSTRTNEEFIASSCGFKSIQEMRKTFKEYCKTTPEIYRKQHHIA